MKRVRTILVLLLAYCLIAFGQLGRLGGEVRYEHQYQDFLFGRGLLTTYLSRNPTLDLRLRGNLFSSRILAYSLFSSVRGGYVKTSNSLYEYSATQYTWNKYNLTLTVLPASPVKLTLAARENSYDFTSHSDFSNDRAGERQQEQRAELSISRVPWLPTLSLSYLRNRSFSALGGTYNVVSQTFGLSATGASDSTGSYNLSSQMSEFRNQLNRDYDRVFVLEFGASRALSDRHGVNISAAYNHYLGYSTLSGSVLYSRVSTNRLRLSTTLSGGIAASLNAQYRSLGLSQSLSYFLNQNFQCGLGLSGLLGTTVLSSGGGGRRQNIKTWGSSASLQHQRTAGKYAFSNSLSVGYSEQRNGVVYNNLSASLGNNVTRPFGNFSATGNYNLTYLRGNAGGYSVIGNTASIVLSGILPHQIQSQSDLRYRADRYIGKQVSFRDQKSLLFSQRLNGSFVFYIPFSLSLTGSASWYYASMSGRTYGWSMNFNSPVFFFRGLALGYTYSRSYDPYYQREIVEHNGSLSYQWRSVSISSRFRYITFPVRVREFAFTMSRPF